MAERSCTVQSGGFAVEIPRALVDELGWSEGQVIAIQPSGGGLTLLPEQSLQERIQLRALTYLMLRVGDATSVGTPWWSGEAWEVPVYLSYRERRLGQLLFDAESSLMPARSSSPAELRLAANEA